MTPVGTCGDSECRHGAQPITFKNILIKYELNVIYTESGYGFITEYTAMQSENVLDTPTARIHIVHLPVVLFLHLSIDG